MGRKIFISYKYHDSYVFPLVNLAYSTTVRNYVDYIYDNILKDDDIYKGEQNNNDMSRYTNAYIKEKLKDKIYDSSVTIVLISPGMKEPHIPQINQWIPWEISYSLKEITRGVRTSHRNSILAVVLPDKQGNYDYYKKYYKEYKLFDILRDNIKNGYIHVAEWNDFKQFPTREIILAEIKKESVPEGELHIKI